MKTVCINNIIILAILVVLSGCNVYQPVVGEQHYSKTLAHEGSPYEKMMDAFATDATNYLKLSQEMMEEGDSIAELIEDTVTKSVDADSLLNVSYNNMLEGDKIERYKKSIEYANEALMLAKQTGEKGVEKKIYHQLSEIYERLDNNECADYYKRKSDEIVDTMSNVITFVSEKRTHWYIWFVITVTATIFCVFVIVIVIRKRKMKNESIRQEFDDEVLLTSKTNTFAKLKPETIVYLKSDKNYITLYYLNDNKELVSTELCQSMSKLLNMIEKQERFFRCHRSYAVNMRYVTSFDDMQVSLSCCPPLPSSKSYVEKFEAEREHKDNV